MGALHSHVWVGAPAPRSHPHWGWESSHPDRAVGQGRAHPQTRIMGVMAGAPTTALHHTDPKLAPSRQWVCQKAGALGVNQPSLTRGERPTRGAGQSTPTPLQGREAHRGPTRGTMPTVGHLEAPQPQEGEGPLLRPNMGPAHGTPAPGGWGWGMG